MAAKSNKSLLSTADVIAMRDEIEELRRELQATTARLAEKERKFEAALLFLPEGTNVAALKIRQVKAAPSRKRMEQPKLPEVTNAPSPKARGPAINNPLTWKGAVMKVLNTAGKGLTHAAIIEALGQSEIADTVEANRKGYYNAITRLEERDRLIVRRGSLIYSRQVIEDLMARGAPIPEQDPTQPSKPRGTPTTRDHVKAILIENPDGLEGPVLIELLKKRECVTKSVFDHDQFVYTLLGKMIESNEIVKVDRAYRLRGTVEMKSGPVARTTDPLH
jgi:hypothetical protein